MQTAHSTPSLRLIPEKSLKKNSVFHGTSGSLATAIPYPEGVSWNVMKVLMRLVLVGLVPVLLVSCGAGGPSVPPGTPQAGPYTFDTFSWPEAGISMDYPDGWFIADSRLAGMVGFFPWEPEPGEDSRTSAGIRTAGLYPGETLASFAQSVRDDVSDLGGPCMDPVPVEVAGRDGLLMECDPAVVFYFVEGETSRFAVSLDREKLPEIVWTHMRDSIRVQ